MTNLIPVLALALAAAGFFVFFTRPKGENEPAVESPGRVQAYILAAIFTVALLVYAYLKRDAFANVWPAGIGLAIGALAAGLSYASAEATESRWGGQVLSIALGTAAAASLHWLNPDAQHGAQLGAVFGCASVAWIFNAGWQQVTGPSVATLALAAASGADYLGLRHTNSVAFAHSGSAFMLMVTAAGLFAALAAYTLRKEQAKQAAVGGVAALALLLLGAYVVGQRYLDIKDAWVISGGAVLVGLVIHWLVPDDEESDPLRVVIASVIWIAVATAAFQLRQGFGMAIAFAGGAAPLLIFANRRALLTMGVLAALALYRVFREDYQDATRALDIGQHYALIGVSLGAVLPLLPATWQGERRPGYWSGVAGMIWILLLCFLTAFVAIILGPKAVIGYLAGFGFATLVQALRGSRSLIPFTLALGLAAWTNLLYDWLGDNLDATRDDKIKLLLPIAVVGLVMSLAIALLSRKRTEGQKTA